MVECISYPLDSISDILNWKQPAKSFNAFPFLPKKQSSSPKTLICHDMAGGYLNDRFVCGLNPSYSGYNFNYWPYIDGFIYFSHHFVTIPPMGWINTGHLNGVAIYGTLITESDNGKEICNQIFETKGFAKHLADKLIKITNYYCFEGWLINIENEIQPEHVPNIIYFLKYLTQSLHKISPHFQVIWYDSITKNGKLFWQNELNEQNMLYFLACDGIFLNYIWNEMTLEKTMLNYAQTLSRCYGSTASAAPVSPGLPPFQNIYVGIDVFGRGMIGGGGFNTSFAMEIVRNLRMSVAIFGVGWTYEKFCSEERKSCDKIFWENLSHVLFPENERFVNLPILTCFVADEIPIRQRRQNGRDKITFSDELESSSPSVPPGYSCNLHCQTCLPPLISKRLSEYELNLSEGGINISLFKHEKFEEYPDDASFKRDYVTVPLYYTDIPLPVLFCKEEQLENPKCLIVALSLKFETDNRKICDSSAGGITTQVEGASIGLSLSYYHQHRSAGNPEDENLATIYLCPFDEEVNICDMLDNLHINSLKCPNAPDIAYTIIYSKYRVERNEFTVIAAFYGYNIPEPDSNHHQITDKTELVIRSVNLALNPTLAREYFIKQIYVDYITLPRGMTSFNPDQTYTCKLLSTSSISTTDVTFPRWKFRLNLEASDIITKHVNNGGTSVCLILFFEWAPVALNAPEWFSRHNLHYQVALSNKVKPPSFHIKIHGEKDDLWNSVVVNNDTLAVSTGNSDSDRLSLTVRFAILSGCSKSQRNSNNANRDISEYCEKIVYNTFRSIITNYRTKNEDDPINFEGLTNFGADKFVITKEIPLPSDQGKHIDAALSINFYLIPLPLNLINPFSNDSSLIDLNKCSYLTLTMHFSPAS